MDSTLAKPAIDGSHPRLLADRRLRDVGSRFAHSARAARQASPAGGLVELKWRSAIVDAAWLHDIGYSDRVTSIGFHPLDGADRLRDRGWPDDTCRLVACHTGASVVAPFRGLDRILAPNFDLPPGIAAAALAGADLTSLPTGQPSTVEDRLADILRRCPSDSIVHRAVAVASPMLLESARELESRLARQGAAA
jgi:hypothetical protein